MFLDYCLYIWSPQCCLEITDAIPASFSFLCVTVSYLWQLHLSISKLLNLHNDLHLCAQYAEKVSRPSWLRNTFCLKEHFWQVKPSLNFSVNKGLYLLYPLLHDETFWLSFTLEFHETQKIHLDQTY